MMRLSALLGGTLPIADRDIAGITCDSRRVESGFAFVCIRGTAQDGHVYAADALKKGAAVVITEEAQGLFDEVTVFGYAAGVGTDVCPLVR